MKLQHLPTQPTTKIFIITESDYDNELNWTIEETDYELIPEEENYFLVKAYEVSENEITDCYLGVMTPERIAGIVVKRNAKGEVIVEGMHQQEKSIIPAMAHDSSGYYELFYAKENPQVGIDVLKSGLPIATNKSAVAEDLGYLLIDEERTEEAIEAFKISEANHPSTEYTFWELAKLYAKLGQMDKQAEYLQKFKTYTRTTQGHRSPNS